MDSQPWHSRPLTQNDRTLSYIGMVIGASLMTLAAFADDFSNTRAITTAVLAGVLFLICLALLIGTYLRVGMPVWRLLFWGNLCGMGLPGVARIILGDGDSWKLLSFVPWGWFYGMGFVSWSKRREGEVERRGGEREAAAPYL